MAQDEIGHARSLYPLLADLIGPGVQSQAETRTQFVTVPFLRRSFSEWTDFVAANFVFDTALTVLLETARDSSVSPLAQRARRIVEEEHLHWLHGEGWTRRLAREGGAVRHHLQASFLAVGQDAAPLFALADESLVGGQVLDAGATAIERAFRERLDPVLQAEGLRVT
ncbi:MAG: hypothetical protein NVS2B16_00390 [Chloroflexota bacterium]